jgi:hypothetical protein
MASKIWGTGIKTSIEVTYFLGGVGGGLPSARGVYGGRRPLDRSEGSSQGGKVFETNDKELGSQHSSGSGWTLDNRLGSKTPKALFVSVGLHPESFHLIKVYIN